MTSKRILTEVDVVRMRQLRRNHHSFEAIGKVFNVAGDTIRRYLDPDYRDQRNRQSKAHSRREREATPAREVRHENEPRVRSIPADVLADSIARRRLSHPTTTAHLCGDPLPGWSALDGRAKPRRNVSSITLAGPSA